MLCILFSSCNLRIVICLSIHKVQRQKQRKDYCHTICNWQLKLKINTSSARALKIWKGTIHSGQSTASCEKITRTRQSCQKIPAKTKTYSIRTWRWALNTTSKDKENISPFQLLWIKKERNLHTSRWNLYLMPKGLEDLNFWNKPKWWKKNDKVK